MIYSFINLKGGVGKTTSAINLAYGLSKAKRKVLLVDLDGQANATHSLLNDEASYTACDALKDPSNTKEYIVKTDFGFDLLAANFDLFKLESLTVQDSDDPYYKKLYKIIQVIKDDYDDIVVDNNPRLEAWATNAIYACKNGGLVIIPIKINKYAINGFKEVADKINRLNDNYEIDIKWKVLITMKNHNNIDKDIHNQLVELVGQKRIFETSIRNQNKPVAESSFTKHMLIDDNKAKVGQDYRNFIDEILKNNVRG